ncbi:MAG: efflux RND transporter periplasmic adaptor subunit [Sphingomonadales bacterium]
MIVFLTLVYVGLLFVLIKLKVLPNSNKVWLTLVPYELVIFFGLFFPMMWGAPSGTVSIITYSVQITPNVSGKVLEVPVEANKPLVAGDVLFRIDPVPYQAALDGLVAQMKLAETRLEQAQSLARQQAGSIYEVQAFEAEVDGLKAQISGAEWNLQETVVRAPSEGFVTNVTLRPGARVTTIPMAASMAFIDTSKLFIGAQIPQIYTRYIEAGQKAEVILKTHPGQVFTATVDMVIPVTAQGQLPVSGFALQSLATDPGPFFVRLVFDDPELDKTIPAGAFGSVAIYTENVEFAHVIRKVMIRMDSYLNFLIPN